MQGDPDATMPAQGRPDPTMPIQTGPTAGEPTVAVTQPGYGGGPGGPGGPGGGDYDDEEDGDRRKLWMIAGGVLVLGLLIGALIAVLASGGDDDTATTTSSSSSTSTSTSTATTTTPTTQQAGPSIVQFAANPNPYQCPGSGQIALTWSTQNTSGVTLSIDGGGPYANYGPTGNAQVPYACPTNQHTYQLTANGQNGQKPQQTLVVQGIAAPTTTTGP